MTRAALFYSPGDYAWESHQLTIGGNSVCQEMVVRHGVRGPKMAMLWFGALPAVNRWVTEREMASVGPLRSRGTNRI